MPVENRMPGRAARTGKRFKIKRETVAGQQADPLPRVRARDGLARAALARSLTLAPSTVGAGADRQVLGIGAGVIDPAKGIGLSYKQIKGWENVPRVVNSQLGPFNGAIGAAALTVHEWKPLPC